MKSFWIRIINIFIICAIIIGYNNVIEARAKAEEIAYQEAVSEANELKDKYGLNENESTEQESYKDGSYEGQADGFGGTIKVSVLVKDGNIESIEILSAESEDSAYLTMAKDIIDNIILAQSPEVDTISGATFSSTGIKNAVINALEGAK